MAGTVIYKIRSPVKRVEFTAKHTTRGIRYKQSTLKTNSPLRSPSKPSGPSLATSTGAHDFEDRFDEPLIQYKGKVSFFSDVNKQ
jgi:hypothetical protein